MKTFFKVNIHKNNKFIGTGEFVLEKDNACEVNDQFSFVSNLRDFYGHDTKQNKNGYKYIFAVVDYEDAKEKSFDEIISWDIITSLFDQYGYKLTLASKKIPYKRIEL